MVMLRAKTSDWAKTANTDANGQFELNAVPLGEYSVSVASPGFVQTDQYVEVNSVRFRSPLSTGVASTKEIVEVTENLQVVATDSATPNTW